jgi:Zn-dependent protease
MFKSKKIATVLGFPVLVDVTFLLLAALFAFQDFGNTWGANLAAIMRAPLLFGAILIHELGHALAYQKFGHRGSRILLWGMGGLCMNNARPTDRNGLLITLAGPAAGLVVGLPVWVAAQFMPWVPALSSMVSFWIYVTIGWSLLNLLPIFPLDGGRALMYGLRLGLKMNRDRSARVAGVVGLVVLAPLALWALSLGQIWTVMVLFFIGRTTWQAWRHGAQAVGA